jgi:hypothetical protein
VPASEQVYIITITPPTLADFSPKAPSRPRLTQPQKTVAAIASKTPGSTPKKRTLSQLVRSVKLSPSRPPKRTTVSTMGAGVAQLEADMELGSSTADAEEPAAVTGAGSSSRRSSLPLARERSAQGYELDCYPYSFSPLLLFAQAQR